MNKILKSESGLAYLEFAIALPILMILFLGSIEISRCFLIIQKVEKTVSTIGDVTAQTDANISPLTTAKMSQLMSAVDDMMSPYSSGANDPKISTIITNITKTGTASPIINWQYCGGGSLVVNSKLGKIIGSNATMPSGLILVDGEEIIIAEVFYNFTPIIGNNRFLAGFQIYRTAVFMPRLGALTNFTSNCP
jgi:Flp pilus assembly protein TadG